MATDRRASVVAAFLAAGAIGGGTALPSVAATGPAALQGGESVSERLAGIRAIAEQHGGSVEVVENSEAKPDSWDDNSFGNTFSDSSNLI